MDDKGNLFSEDEAKKLQENKQKDLIKIPSAVLDAVSKMNRADRRKRYKDQKRKKVWHKK